MIFKIIGIVVGIICLLGFGAPVAAAGIVNIGNVTGILLSLLLILYAFFATAVHKFIRKLWEKRSTKIPVVAVGVCVIICAILVVVESAFMVDACAKPASEDATAVVLGYRVYGERASLSLVERLDAAYEYLSDHPEAKCVVSGGQGPGEDISEAECMYRFLVNKGIAPERIYKEDLSTSTEENIAFSKEVIARNGLPEEIVIVTNEYHIYRAGMIATENALNWGAKPAKTAYWLFPTYYVRELYGILAEWIFY